MALLKCVHLERKLQVLNIKRKQGQPVSSSTPYQTKSGASASYPG